MQRALGQKQDPPVERGGPTKGILWAWLFYKYDRSKIIEKEKGS